MTEISTAKIDRTATSILKKQADMRAKVKRLFDTPDGQDVYEWLMDQFYHNQHIATEEDKLARHAGRRDVMVLLRGIVETKK
jgi:hypothetical protein